MACTICSSSATRSSFSALSAPLGGDLRQHHRLKLVIVRLLPPRRRVDDSQLRHRRLPHASLAVHLLLQPDDVLPHAFQRGRLSLEPLHLFVVHAGLALVHAGHHRLRDVPRRRDAARALRAGRREVQRRSAERASTEAFSSISCVSHVRRVPSSMARRSASTFSRSRRSDS